MMFASPVWAAETKFGGLIFGEWAMHASERTSTGLTTASKGRHSFGITRIYLNAEAKFTPKLKAKMVLEGNSTTAGNAVFVKNAFGDYAFTDYGNLTFGMIGTAWISNEEGIWGRRYVQKTYLDETSILKSADNGLGLLGKLPKGYGDVHLYYVNGEGYNAVELSTGMGRSKDFGGRITLIPMPGHDLLGGLKVHGFVQQGRIREGAGRLRDRYVAGVSYQHEKFHLMYSYTHGQDGSNFAVSNNRNLPFDAYSLHGSAKLPKGFSAFGRYDKVSFNKTNGSDNYSRGIAGVEYKLAEGARVALSDQWIQTLSATGAAAKYNENQIKANVELKF